MSHKMGQTEKHHLSQLRQKSASEHDALIKTPQETQTPATRGDRLAAIITGAIATWKFILIQTGIIIFWTSYNLLIKKSAFDPFPFILLNLFLSFQSAYTAPAIMMNQKRQAKNDEIRNEMESDINVKVDLELVELAEKIEDFRKQDLAEIKQQLKELTLMVERLSPNISHNRQQNGINEDG